MAALDQNSSAAAPKALFSRAVPKPQNWLNPAHFPAVGRQKQASLCAGLLSGQQGIGPAGLGGRLVLWQAQ